MGREIFINNEIEDKWAKASGNRDDNEDVNRGDFEVDEGEVVRHPIDEEEGHTLLKHKIKENQHIGCFPLEKKLEDKADALAGIIIFRRHIDFIDWGEGEDACE